MNTRKDPEDHTANETHLQDVKIQGRRVSNGLVNERLLSAAQAPSWEGRSYGIPAKQKRPRGKPGANSGARGEIACAANQPNAKCARQTRAPVCVRLMNTWRDPP